MNRPPSSSQSSRVETGIAIGLAFVTVAGLTLRATSIAQPLGIDQGLWASAVRAMSRGQLLYHDVWEQRPPGIYLVYLAGHQLFGWTSSTVAWLDNLAAAATSILLWLIARRLGGRLAGWTASAFYAALTMPAWLFNHGGFLERSVCETFIIVAAAAGAWCAVTFREDPRPLPAFGIGLAGGAAALMKPNAGIYFVAALAWLALYRPEPGRRWTSARLWVPTAAAGAAVLPVLVLAWLFLRGIVPDAKVAVVDFNRYYVALQFELADYVVKFAKAVWLRVRSDPAWLAGAVSVVAALVTLVRTRRLPPLAGLAVLWGGACVVAIVVNGTWLFNSYFLPAYAPLVLLATWFVVQASRSGGVSRAAALATVGLMAVFLVRGDYLGHVMGQADADLNVLLGRTDRGAYLDAFGGYDNARGYSARANRELAEYVGSHTTPEQRIFLLGISGAEVYFDADRLPAHRFLRVNFYVDNAFPNPDFRLAPVADALAARRPTYLILERLHSKSTLGAAVDGLETDPVMRRVLDAYVFERRIEDFVLYRLRADR